MKPVFLGKRREKCLRTALQECINLKDKSLFLLDIVKTKYGFPVSTACRFRVKKRQNISFRNSSCNGRLY